MLPVIDMLNDYKYVIDTSSILSQKIGEQHERDIYQSLWENVDSLVKDKIIITCDEVICELHDDDIIDWAKKVVLYSVHLDDEIQENVKRVVSVNKKLVDFKSVKSSGDAFLIATALKYNLIVISEESKLSDKKIPHTCELLGLKCINILELCKMENWKF